MFNLSSTNSFRGSSGMPSPTGFCVCALRSSQRLLAMFHPLAAAAFVAVLLLSSMYCVLAYIPTTYYAFIQAPFQSWMPMFARLQPYLFTIAFCGVAVQVWARVHNPAVHKLALEFLLLGITASVYLIWARPVQLVRNSSLSFLWAIAFLLPVTCLGALEYSAHLPKLKSESKERRSISFVRVTLAGLFVGLLYPATAYLRSVIAGQRATMLKGDVIVWVWALVVHVSLFLFVFSVIEFTSGLSERAGNPTRARFLLFTGLCWLGVAVAFYKVILASIPFAGIEAMIYAGLFALAGVTIVGGWLLSRRVRQRDLEAPGSGRATAKPRKIEIAVLPLFLLASALAVPFLIGVMDWNSVLEKSWAMTYWILVAGIFVHRWRGKTDRSRHPAWVAVLTAVSSLLAFRMGVQSDANWKHLLSQENFDVAAALGRRERFDASFAAATELLTPSSARPCNQQCEFVQNQTNIPTSARVDVHNVNLVEKLQPTAGPKPNIFVFVVDSLRQDYVSPYNHAVSFTPAMETFASESVVFRNAFTRYSGTTLSEPSIWSGMLLLHKHYVQPFHRVNNLEKLTQADGYQSFITVDTVLRVLLESRPNTVELDSSAPKWTDVDLCSTAADFAGRITSQQDRSRPIFFYTQSQNIHIVTLRKIMAVRPPKKSYAPFVDYYSSELQRLDGCFGDFIQTLKSRGLYDNSIIVLTSDHGDALQEVGAERHAFSLKPEVIRIPLIIHVPAQIKKTWYYDPDAIAFNSDITPTLYELLGHAPVVARAEFGRPLFTRTSGDAQEYRRSSYMIASSYGPLYGLLYDNGKKLFIENESKGTEEFFDLTKDPGATHSLLTEAIRQRSEAQLHADLQRIADLFGYKYEYPSLLDWLMR
jgi:arylsulfatase A-like enzyme